MSKNLDGRDFTLFVKFVNELRHDVLDNPQHKITPDSFLIFIDKMRSLTHAQGLNDMLIARLEKINIDLLKTKKMLNIYQQNSIQFKFEEKIRMGEIK